ncbi:hypothetical protein ACFYOT_25235 [Saccharothrix saharensis]|uniref:SMODS domain-containing nucleotidyltransferase n=1 Tax=Saccharothrix saharensis TaxID=571190 RepID=UPI003698FEDC
MNVETAFDEYQKHVNANAGAVKLARERRDQFIAGLKGQRGVVEVWLSGSLRRLTQLDPVHDVDLVLEFDRAVYPDWGLSGPSAGEAVALAKSWVKEQLGNPGGTYVELVRRADERNRAVKCFIDDPEDPKSFTVDVMPALRQANGILLIPSVDDSTWIEANPQHLIKAVADRQEAWNYTVPLIRVIKDWRYQVTGGAEIESLLMEVLALECLPAGPTRPLALSTFFTRAAVRVNQPVEDPAGLCGPIQPDLDVTALREALEKADDLAAGAVSMEANGDCDRALRLWGEVFGSSFPVPEPSSQRPKIGVPALILPGVVRDSPQG